jgi:Ni,Fe-hydrogenase III small subunit/ferredoxin
MLKTIGKVIKYRTITQGYPKVEIDKEFFIGKPEINQSKCTKCGECLKRCPSNAIVQNPSTGEIGINIDECIFCVLCEDVCQFDAMHMTNEFEMAEKDRMNLRKSPLILEERDTPASEYEVICAQVSEKIQKTFGRSLQIREVNSGSCNGCDYEVNGLNNSINDIERLGIRFVASPRHADMLLVTGTVSRNMELALIKTYNATPDPKLVVAVGACACSGGMFKDSYANLNGIDSVLPVDVYVPGCPPRPLGIIYGILKALEKME